MDADPIFCTNGGRFTRRYERVVLHFAADGFQACP
jgi:hypothetical protein